MKVEKKLLTSAEMKRALLLPENFGVFYEPKDINRPGHNYSAVGALCPAGTVGILILTAEGFGFVGRIDGTGKDPKSLQLILKAHLKTFMADATVSRAKPTHGAIIGPEAAARLGIALQYTAAETLGIHEKEIQPHWVDGPKPKEQYAFVYSHNAKAIQFTEKKNLAAGTDQKLFGLFPPAVALYSLEPGVVTRVFKYDEGGAHSAWKAIEAQINWPKGGAYRAEYQDKVHSAFKALNGFGATLSDQLKPAFQGADFAALLASLAKILLNYVEATVKSKSAQVDKSPRTQRALELATRNFVSNITETCTRVAEDFADIGKMFFDKEKIGQLRRIKCSGSDSHKGGKQVLFLQFSIGTTTKTKLIVYKPSDIETDDLLVGAGPHSFASVINSALAAKYRIPSYRFLPRNPGSGLRPGKDGSLPICSSYGYIEFLGAGPDAPDGASAAHSHFRTLQDAELVQYFQKGGALLAMASTLGVIDLHAGNVVPYKKMPHLIDLEFGFHGKLVHLVETSLIGNPAQSGLEAIYEMELGLLESELNEATGQITYEKKGKKEAVVLDADPGIAVALYQGYLAGISAIVEKLDDIERMLKEPRVRLSVGRYNVFPTGKLFDEGLKKLFGKTAVGDGELNSALLTRFQGQFIAKEATPLQKAANTYAHTWRDFENTDLPCYYHRASERHVYDARGDLIGGASKPLTLPSDTLSQTLAGVVEMRDRKKLKARVLTQLTDISKACHDKGTKIGFKAAGGNFWKDAGGNKFRVPLWLTEGGATKL